MAINKIFLSYSRVDGAAFAKRLSKDLSAEGFDVWIDQEDINAGRQWDIEIQNALENCDCLLFIETKKSVDSANVLDEVYYALEQKKKVIPLIVVDSKTPFRLQRIQHIDFTNHYHAGLGHLIAELRKTSSDTTAFDQSNGSTSPTKNSKSLNPFTGWGIAAVVLLLAVVAIFYWSKKTETGPKSIVTSPLPADSFSNNTSLVDSLLVSNEDHVVFVATEKKIPTTQKIHSTSQQTLPGAVTPAKSTSFSASMLKGDWNLVSVSVNATSSDGFIKISDAGNDKIGIQGHVRFFYPKVNDTLFLNIFNAFTSCEACAVSSTPIKLSADDVAIGSQYYQVLRTDMPPDNKAGDTITSAGSNRSLRAIASLKFLSNTAAELAIERPDAAELSHGLVLKPFRYIFKFTKAPY